MTERRVATYQDVIDAPPFKVAEIVGGELFVSPRPRPWACFAKTRLGAMLGAELMLHRGVEDGWFILNEPELRLGGDVLVPDIAGWRRKSMPYLREDDEDDEDYDRIDDYPVDPDWVCEILLPGRADHDLKFKAGVYLEEQVPWYWVVHADDGVVQVLRNAGAEWAVHATFGRGDVARVPPFEELEIDVRRLFLPVRPPVSP